TGDRHGPHNLDANSNRVRAYVAAIRVAPRQRDRIPASQPVTNGTFFIRFWLGTMRGVLECPRESEFPSVPPRILLCRARRRTPHGLAVPLVVRDDDAGVASTSGASAGKAAATRGPSPRCLRVPDRFCQNATGTRSPRPAGARRAIRERRVGHDTASAAAESQPRDRHSPGQDRSGRPIALLSGGPIMRQFDRSSAVGVQKKFERALLLVQCWSDG